METFTLTAAGLIHVMEADGYQRRNPSRNAAEIDAEVCREARCTCGHVGLEYWPFIHPQHRSYRAFAVCPKCGRPQEF